MSLLTTELSPAARKRLEVIAREVNHATELVQQILDFGRRTIIKRHPLIVKSVLKEMVKLLKRTLPESIQINLIVESGNHIINADPMRVQQVITNLAFNAREHMPDGGELNIILSGVADVKINCVDCGQVAEGKWVRMVIQDSGSGIPSDVLPHIFEPFFTTRAPLGHGLGLAQVYGIVMQHEGHIEVDTELGQGTTFKLYWPALLEAQPQSPVPVQLDVKKGAEQTILIVEDNEPLRDGLVNTLEMLGYQTLEAANGREALDICTQYGDGIALILSDWVMPSMSGLELARELEKRYMAMQVLIMTGHPLDAKIKMSMPENVVSWMLKPLSLEKLAEVVAQSLAGE